jgi:soluble lytic murein transglycosylase-like protein
MGDTARAVVLAQQPIRRYPSTYAARRVLRQLERVLGAQGAELSADLERRAAEVDVRSGDLSGAARRLERSLAGTREQDRWRLFLRRGEVSRLGGRIQAALGALDQALAAAPDSMARAQVLLERARVLRDRGRWRDAVRVLEQVAGGSEDTLRGQACWEGARILESKGEWRQALAGYGNAARSSEWRGDEAALRAGLMALAAGLPDTALGWFERCGEEGARFWGAVVRRRVGQAEADSVLAAIARTPGYTFYRAAARDSLGLTGWSGEFPVREVLDCHWHCRPVGGVSRFALHLIALGRPDVGKAVLSRWLMGSLARPGEAGAEAAGSVLLRAACIAYSAGWNPLGIAASSRALDVAVGSPARAGWSIVPWLYPPAHDRAFAALPESASADEPDRALMRAVAWKESRFDARARSRSDALGLVQLKLGTAADEARSLRERRPQEKDLFDSVRNVRYGTSYLARQMARFGSLHRALAAYNAGPTALARWLSLWEKAPGRALGGAALECELMCRPETIRYVKEVLAAYQAYRELRPITTF